MPRIEYEPWTPRFADHLQVVSNVDRICRDFAARGYSATLRQVYYQLVARDLFPDSWKYSRSAAGKWVKDPAGTKNAEPNYKILGDLVSKARRSGRLDWNHIEDRTRALAALSHWNSPADIIDSAAYSYRRDLREGQDIHVEVWVEKEALADVVARAANRWDVPYFACRGYVSDSEMWRAGQRLDRAAKDHNRVVVLHLGDHDPSGIDMTRDITDRLTMFMDHYGMALEVDRIALNMDQVRQYNPPPNPAKVTDSRYEGYLDRFGDESWELDALDPDVIVALIEEHVEALTDTETFYRVQGRMNTERDFLRMASGRWDDIVRYLGEDE